MKRFILIVLCLFFSSIAFAEDNATLNRPSDPSRVQNATQALNTSAITSKLPLDIQAKGTDSSGTLLSYKIKEELMASKLFALSVADKKKFVLLLQTRPEFPDRPTIASHYSIALVYQEDAGILTYYLDQIQGQVHAEGVAAEVQKILEWSYATVKRYTYLLEE